MTGEEWQEAVRRLGVWWSVGLRPWTKSEQKLELFDEFFDVSLELFLDGLQSFLDEGRETCPSPAAFRKRLLDLAPVLLVPPSGPCQHDGGPYPFSFDTPSPGAQVVVLTCRFCGAERRRSPSEVRTPGQDSEERYERRSVLA